MASCVVHFSFFLVPLLTTTLLSSVCALAFCPVYKETRNLSFSLLCNLLLVKEKWDDWLHRCTGHRSVTKVKSSQCNVSCKAVNQIKSTCQSKVIYSAWPMGEGTWVSTWNQFVFVFHSLSLTHTREDRQRVYRLTGLANILFPFHPFHVLCIFALTFILLQVKRASLYPLLPIARFSPPAVHAGLASGFFQLAPSFLLSKTDAAAWEGEKKSYRRGREK